MESPKQLSLKESSSTENIELEPVIDKSECIVPENPSNGDMIDEIHDSCETNDEMENVVGSKVAVSVTDPTVERNDSSSAEIQDIESNAKGKYKLVFSIG